MQITLPWPPAVLNPNKRVHWSVKSKATKAYRKACYVLCLEAGLRGIPWDGDIHLWIDFVPPDRRGRDQDNMISSAKALFDGLSDALSVNDKRFRLHPYVRDEVGGMIKVTITPGPSIASPAAPESCA